MRRLLIILLVFSVFVPLINADVISMNSGGSETTMVEDQVEFKRNFDTGILPLGKYIVGLQLVYPNGVAPSSAHFEVIEKPPISVFGKIVFFLIILILIILILIIIILIQRRRKKNKQAVTTAPQA
ncbi:unnamed protein product [marine sediment metagenome]|uniref:Uncharacterized protein n=1 Tax=marine sediment metagenome TaxID=412755 RepID=X1SDK7_9ZZZZ